MAPTGSLTQNAFSANENKTKQNKSAFTALKSAPESESLSSGQ